MVKLGRSFRLLLKILSKFKFLSNNVALIKDQELQLERRIENLSVTTWHQLQMVGVQ